MSDSVTPQNAIVVIDSPVIQPKQEAHPNLNKGNFGNDGGRPTKYEIRFADLIIEYFNQERYIKYVKAEKTITKANGTQEKFYEYGFLPNDLPTLDKFARTIGVNGDTLVTWATERYPADHADPEKRGQLKRPKFSAAYHEAKILQKEFLMDNGLRGMYNPAAFMFVAKNITTMRDKSAVNEKPEEANPEHTQKRVVGFNYLPPTQVDANNTDNQADA
jgi:hypothetical protein